MPEEDVSAVLECLESGWLTMGPRTQALEAAIAEELDVPHVACVSSGSAALHLSCLAAGLGPGDEAVVPSAAFVAAAAAVRACGAEPVFCDVVSPGSPLIDPADVERRITDRTKVVLAVHLCGYAADTDSLRELCDERGLRLIEDAAQAIRASVGASGAMAGTAGDLGCLSFFSTSQLCVGEGGAVIYSDDGLATKVRSLRSHAMSSVTWDRHRGYSRSYDIDDVGFNFRFDEPRAALGMSRLPRLAGEIDRRREVVRGYCERLAGRPEIDLMFDDDAVEAASHGAFPVLTTDRAARDRFRDNLSERGIQTTWYPAVHRFSGYQSDAELAHTEAFAERHFCLPLSPTLEDEDLDHIAEAVTEVAT